MKIHRMSIALAAAGVLASLAFAATGADMTHKPTQLNPQPEPPGRRMEDAHKAPAPSGFCLKIPERLKQCRVNWDQCIDARHASRLGCERKWRTCCARMVYYH